MTKKPTTRDALPVTFEMACTDALVDDGARLRPCWLFTLVDIHLGVTIDAVLIAQAVTYPAKFGSFWTWLDFAGEDTSLLKISVPDSSVLTDDELAALPWGPEITVVRRQPGQGLHPVHEAAIDILLTSLSTCISAGMSGGQFDHFVGELQSFGLFEHRFGDSANLRHRSNPAYRQARTGAADDEHSGHDFRPCCCGLFRLLALHALDAKPDNRRHGGGFSDLQNGA